MANKILIGGIQAEPRETRQETLNSFFRLIDEAGHLGVKAVCLNDYLLSWPPDAEHSTDYVKKEAETVPGPTVDALANKAKEYGMIICNGTMIEKDSSGKFYTSSALIGSDGDVIGVHRKRDLLNGGLKLEKDSGIEAGTVPNKVYTTPIGKIGLLLDTEANNYQTIDELIKGGVKLVFWPISWTVRVTVASFGNQHPIAKYIGNKGKTYVVCTNKVGLRKAPSGYTYFSQNVRDSNNLLDRTPLTQVLYPGGTMIVSKTGAIVGAAEDYKDDLAVAAVDMQQLQ